MTGGNHRQPAEGIEPKETLLDEAAEAEAAAEGAAEAAADTAAETTAAETTGGPHNRGSRAL